MKRPVMTCLLVVSIGGVILSRWHNPGPATAAVPPRAPAPARAEHATPSHLVVAPVPAPAQTVITEPTEHARLLALNQLVLDEETGTQYWLLFQKWAERAPAEAAAALALCPERMHMDFIGMIAPAWARQAPLDAVAWAMQLPHPGQRTYALEMALPAWAADNPGDAFNWATQKLPADLQIEGVRYVMGSWFRTDPESASEALAVLATNPRFPELLSFGVDALFKNNPAEAVRLIEIAGFPPAEENRLGSALRRWREANLAEASAWLAKHRSILPAHVLAQTE